MPRRSDQERIEQLEAKLKAVKARANKKRRARDTRLKVLLGTILLYKMFDAEKDGKAAGWARNFVLKYGSGFFYKNPSDQAVIDEFLNSDEFVAAHRGTRGDGADDADEPTPRAA